MTPDDNYLHAILTDPDDDYPRLQYAAPLDDQGDARGEFIPVPSELAQLSRWDPRRPPLEAREQSLLQEHRAEWLGPLRDVLEDDSERLRGSRRAFAHFHRSLEMARPGR